jgi:hypothetical protein
MGDVGKRRRGEGENGRMENGEWEKKIVTLDFRCEMEAQSINCVMMVVNSINLLK